jgi:hypothetical protein
LKARLARTLGEEVAASHPEHGVSSAIVKDLHAEVEQLIGAQDQLRRQLRDTEEELEGARRLNRTLIRERMRLRPNCTRDRYPTPPGMPPAGSRRDPRSAQAVGGGEGVRPDVHQNAHPDHRRLSRACWPWLPRSRERHRPPAWPWGGDSWARGEGRGLSHAILGGSGPCFRPTGRW